MRKSLLDQDPSYAEIPFETAYFPFIYDVGDLGFGFVSTEDPKYIDQMGKVCDAFARDLEIPQLNEDLAPFYDDRSERAGQLAYMSGELHGSRLYTDALANDTPPEEIDPETLMFDAVRMAKYVKSLDISSATYLVCYLKDLRGLAGTPNGKQFGRGFKYSLEQMLHFYQANLNGMIGAAYRKPEKNTWDRQFVVLGYAALNWLLNIDVAGRHYDRTMFRVCKNLLEQGELIEQVTSKNSRRLTVTDPGIQFLKDYAAEHLTEELR